MKYIIQESRINSLIAKYLDSINWLLWDIGDGEFDLSDGYMTNTKINYRIKNNPVFDEEYEIIYINYDFVSKLCKLFSQPIRDFIVSVIIEWFNKKYNKNVSWDDWQYQDEDEEEDDVYED
jgi:hypothetical protein